MVSKDASSLLESSQTLCKKIQSVALQPHISLADSYRLQSLICDISSAVNVAAAIIVDSEKIFNLEDSSDAPVLDT